MNLVYRVGTVSREQIHEHLKICDADFVPRLSSRVDLDAYADKIFEKAVSFEAWDGHVLAGMLNVYLNDTRSRTGYITNQSVLKEYTGKGVGTTLMRMCLEYAQRLGFDTVRAEVSPDNVPNNRLLARAGFTVVKESGQYLLMECRIIAQHNEGLQ